MTPKANLSPLLEQIAFLLPRALHRDRCAVAHEYEGLKKKFNGGAADGGIRKRLTAVKRRLERSAGVKEKRIGALPRVLPFPDLPISYEKDRIVRLVSEQPVVIVSGETGSGKTTQLPKFCLEAGRGIEGRIACTQPRRIAAITVAARIAEELGQQPGASVGYKIRFSDKLSEQSVIKMVTDGMLLSETQADPFLNEYDTIIVDEAHERSLNIDFLLGILKRLIQKRPDLKLIITSATIDTEKFSKAFFDAPVVDVSGRMYPVDVEYMPPENVFENSDDFSYVDGAVHAVDRVMKRSPFGDILVFMPTEQDIRETCEILEANRYKGATVLPLYARLAAPDQSRVFKPAAGRKIIVATNVAETSITIPNIKYVVDTGLARISHYIPATRTTALPISPVSKSSADQRMGRCGRVQNGVCIRLYSEEDYLSRPLYTPPEILRANLAEVILRMIALRLGDIDSFEFVDAPPAKQIRDGFGILFELDAIEKPGEKRKKAFGRDVRLTPKGRMMAKMPLDPRLSRMLIEARENGVLYPVCAIASALTLPDPRQRPEGSETQANQAHARFVDPASDFITLYNMWRGLVGDTGKNRPQVRAKDLKQYAGQHFFSFRRMREWIDVYDQVTSIISDAGMLTEGGGDVAASLSAVKEEKGKNGFSALYAAIHKSILSGFLANIAEKRDKNLYRGARQREVMIFPGSGVFNRGGQWIVSAEIVETTRRFARTVANIDSAWLEPLGKFLCHYTYSNPVWQRKSESVIAREQVSLYGLIIVSGRPVQYGKIDPETAANIFIRDALVGVDVKNPLPFMEHNRAIAEEIRDMENRVRRRDLLASEDDMVRFYEKRIGGIYDMRSLRRLIRKKGSDDFLRMSVSDLMDASPDDEEMSRFPDHMVLGDGRFSLTYRFNPGENDDGVTLTLPVSAAGAMPKEATDWVVPGLLEEKITAMIKNLPKAYRKQLVPVNETVAVVLEKMPVYTGSLAGTLSRFIRGHFGVDIPVSKWSEEGLPPHLRLRFSLVDNRGQVLFSGRDRSVLNGLPREEISADHLAAEKKRWEKTGIVTWDVGDLPEMISIDGQNGQVLPAYPVLEPDDQGVNLRLYTDRTKALATHKNGVARLFSIYFSKEIKHLKKNIAFSGEMKTCAMVLGGGEAVASAIVENVIGSLFAREIRKETDFYEHAANMVNRILPEGRQLAEKIRPVLLQYREIRQRLGSLSSTAPPALLQCIEASLAGLVPDNFIALYSADRIGHLPRYLKALSLRLERGVNDPEKDSAKEEKIEKYRNRLDELVKSLDAWESDEKRAAVEDYFWMIEEYKVQLFAQEIKTAVRVSEKRLQERYAEIREDRL